MIITIFLSFVSGGVLTAWGFGWYVHRLHDDLSTARREAANWADLYESACSRVADLLNPKLTRFEQLVAKHKKDSAK